MYTSNWSLPVVFVISGALVFGAIGEGYAGEDPQVHSHSEAPGAHAIGELTYVLSATTAASGVSIFKTGSWKV